VSVVHQIVADAVVAATIGLLAAAAWSVATVRRSNGDRDHRFAVDRLLVAVVVLVAFNDLLGLLLLGGSARPADPLHLLYGVAALVTLPTAWAVGGRRRGGRAATRLRRDVWIVGAAIVMLGLELRLFMTG
jgi:hypothetical protein